MDCGTEKSVVEHVAYTRKVIRIVVCRTRNAVPRDSLGAMGLASISVMKAAKSPILWA